MYVFPTSDIDTGSYWSAEPFWSKLADGDDAYVVASLTYLLSDSFIVGLSNTAKPVLADAVVYRIALSTLMDMRVSLMEGTTERAYWTHRGGGLVTYTRTLTQGQVDAITDPTDLRFKFTGTGQSLSAQTAYVYRVSLELGTTPDGIDYAVPDGKPHYRVTGTKPHYRVED